MSDLNVQNNADSGSPAWVWVGKLATIVAVVGGIVTVYQNTTKEGTRLQANCDFLQSSKAVEKMTSSLIKDVNGQFFKEALQRSLKNTTLNAQQRTEATTMIDAELSYKFLQAEQTLHSNFSNKVIACKVLNLGEKEAREVTLNIPSGKFSWHMNGNVAASENGEIRIGSIRQGLVVEIEILSDAFYEYDLESRLFLNHAEGKGTVQISTRVSGFPASVASFLLSSAFWLLLLLLIPVSLITALIFSNVTKEKTATSGTSDVAADVVAKGNSTT